MLHVIQHYETGKFFVLTTRKVVNLVNEDRSKDWTNYTKHDFIEGLECFTDYYYIGVVQKYKPKPKSKPKKKTKHEKP